MGAVKSLAWRSRLIRSSVPSAVIPWLRHEGSLTARLQERGDFSLHLIRQTQTCADREASAHLGKPRMARACVREVALYCNGQPVVFAHTVLPCQPRGPLNVWLAGLGNRPLGALIFSHAGFIRGPLAWRRLSPRHALYLPAIRALHLAEDPPPELWARRSRFSFGQQSASVTEVFSPTLYLG